MVTNLTKKQIENIQIDESLIFLDYGEPTEQFLAPTRGGGEFAATVTVRDIEFDGKHGKTAGTQVIEEQGAHIKVTTLCMSQENLARTIPNCTIEDKDGKVLKNPKTGVIPLSAYLKNITMFAKLIGGNFKKITIYNPMHETGFNTKAVQKAAKYSAAACLQMRYHLCFPHTPPLKPQTSLSHPLLFFRCTESCTCIQNPQNSSTCS